jgi:hypothetical protein
MDKKRKLDIKKSKEEKKRKKRKEDEILVKFHSWSGCVKFDFLNGCRFHPFA